MNDYTKDWESLFEQRDNLKQNIKEKSIGTKPVKKTNRAKQRSVAIALSVILIATGVVGPKIVKAAERSTKINEASLVVKNEAQDILLENGLAEYDEKGNVVIKSNAVDDYAKLGLDKASFEELYAYYLATGKDAREFDKLIQSIHGVDGVHNYLGLTQFYSYNGFKGPEGGFPEFEKYAQDELIEALQNGSIDNVVKGNNTNTNRR